MSSHQSGSTPQVSVQEFSIRVPKNLKKRHHVMRFNGNLNVDFTKWHNVKMERENNMREFKMGNDEAEPKFGAGSEYNRDFKEEVRRKKFGIISRKYRPEAQPWILKVGGKSGKKFKGIREGGVSDNASFFVFTHAPDGAIEAYPLNEWYNFQPIQRYKTLSAEEAEHELSNRKKALNLFALMLRKRMKGEDEEETVELDGEKKKGGRKKEKGLKISEMDEWMDSDEEESDSDEEGAEKEKEDSDNDAKKKKKKGAPVKKKKKDRDVDDEAFEESDDGDEEGRELDYISDSSESDSEPDNDAKASKELKSVAEEDGLRNLLTSDEDDEEEQKKSGEEDKSDDENNKKNKDGKKEDGEKEKKKKKKKKKKAAANQEGSSSDATSESSDSEAETNSKKKKKDKNGKSGSTSRSGSPSQSQESSKRKASSMPTDLTASENSNSPSSTPAKKPKLESTPLLPPSFTGIVSSNSKEDYGITEEAVRRYLMRKPMTTIELLTKFKNKKTGVSSDKLVETMTAILKKINPVKQTIQGKMYLSIKASKSTKSLKNLAKR